ncbi:hypothetical protein B1987_14900 [Mycobacterium kansasii]|uniref:Wadjet protein JetD C-terminal domain-containing protein n=1 Tax=Mycobacterium attenuatum TaxID=2341086 RepID=A0A498PK29_9MYCO|nr:DUF3322 and DUF2220 domain-containing protein [Mycobacterium attenuatum]ORB84863.1 hypothetical protein B1987_14900 [Mycobacterium kansasii]VBA31475.1 hypothetical protein LAUMK136_00067 [Mycobacterium attenuatum]
MITVEQAIAKVASIVENRWRDWACGRKVWPFTISLHPPRGAALAADVLEAQIWAGVWQAAEQSGTLPGQLERVARRVKGSGLYPLPEKLIIPDINSALTTVPATARRYRRALARHEQAVATPAVQWNALSDISIDTMTRIDKLDDRGWAIALAVAEYVTSQPVTGMMMREIAIEGVHTKWIEQNATLLLDLISPPESTQPDGNPVARLQHVLGLRAKDTRVNVALRCPRLRSAVAGIERFSATIGTLNDSQLSPAIVLIVENDQPGYTLDNDIQGLVVVHGLGDSATTLVALRWLQTAERVLYWGDIDRAGLQIIASLRRAGIQARGILMDCATLDTYRDRAHKAPKIQAADITVPTGLTADEAHLYDQLNAHYERTGEERQLEQEHLPSQTVQSALVAACSNRAV